ncbi:MAG: hypothetical protein FWB72_05890 [Firmicutes bacterium]|nr:hypothetical protein [Bacillota bacterium]
MKQKIKQTTWTELQKELFTPEEIAASELRVALITEFVEAREKGINKNIGVKDNEQKEGCGEA